MKIHTIIQARSGSTRLPCKVFEKIGPKQVLQMVIERCERAERPDKTILAWHGDQYNPGDLPYIRQRVPWVRGPEEPAARFLVALAEHPCDAFIRVCADSPFIDPDTIDEAANRMAEQQSLYVHVDNGFGNQAEGFITTSFLSFEANMRGDEREHLGLFYRRRHRLTIDEPADLERARCIMSKMKKSHLEYSYKECQNLLRSK